MRRRKLTKKVMNQRVGFTEGSLATINDISQLYQINVKTEFSRSLIIRRALEFYAHALREVKTQSQLYQESRELIAHRGNRGRRPLINTQVA